MLDNLPSNKQFGLTFAVIFLIIYFIFEFNNIINYLILSSSFVLLFLGLINSKILNIPNLIWYKFGLILSKIVTPIVSFFLYISLIAPVSIIMKCFGKKFIECKIEPKKNSYWKNVKNLSINFN